MWKCAIKKVQSVNTDPWHDFFLNSTPVLEAKRHRYSAIKKKWVEDKIKIKMEFDSFNRGAMRECFRM